MKSARLQSTSGFTLAELLIGMSLALVVMTAVLSSYILIGRNLFRLVNQQALVAQGQRAIAYLTQDVRMASGISGTPSATSLVLILPTNSSSTTTVTWTYDSTAGTLTRTPSSGATLTLLSYLTSSSFGYYDVAGRSYTSTTLSAGSYLPSIKQVSLSFSAQKGDSFNGTQTPVYQGGSPRLTLRNTAFQQ